MFLGGNCACYFLLSPPAQKKVTKEKSPF